MDLLTKAADDTARMDTHEVAAYLLERLGPTLVAYIANSRSRSMPKRWATDPSDPDHAVPSTDKKSRLQAAHAIFVAIETSDNDQIARNWLIAANPRLDGVTPAQAIREGRFKDAFSASKAFVSDTYYA